MSDSCCLTYVPSVQVTVSPSVPGCLAPIPRDLVGDGLFVQTFVFVADPMENTFQGIDSQGATFSVIPEQSQVSVNGSLLAPSDYTLTKNVLTLNRECFEKDIVTVVTFREPDGDSQKIDELEARIAAIEAHLGMG